MADPVTWSGIIKAVAWVGSAVTGATVAGVTATGVGAFAVKAAAWAALSAATSATVSKQPRNSRANLDVKIATQAGYDSVIGRTATGGFMVHEYGATSSRSKFDNAIVCSFLLLSGCGPVDSVHQFIVNDRVVSWNNSTGAVSTTEYKDHLWVKTALGGHSQSALTAPNWPSGWNITFPSWTSSHQMRGFSHAWVSQWMEEGSKVWSGGFNPLFVLRGVKAYDPRQDSTYPGGSGTQRINDQSTWAWSENPAVVALTYYIGWRQNGVLVGGAGLDPAGIDMAAFVSAANVCDTNNWKVGGTFNSLESPWAVAKEILASAGAEPIASGSLLSCIISTPRTSSATITIDDLAGEFSIPATKPRRDRINSVIPRFRSENHNWEVVPALAVTVPSYVTTDGKLRQKEYEYRFCQGAKQAGQLAAYDIVNSREFGPVVLTLKPRAMGIRVGDAITVNIPEKGLNDQLCIVRKRDVEPGTNTVILTVESETTSKHAFALGQDPHPPETAGLTRPDIGYTAPPDDEDWTSTPGSDVNGMPSIVLERTDEALPLIASVTAWYRAGTDTPWIAWPSVPVSQRRIEITGIAGLHEYGIAVSYTSIYGTPSDRTILTNVTTPVLVSDGAEGLVDENGDIIDSVDLIAEIQEAMKAGIPHGPDLPATAEEGDQFYNTTDERLYVWHDGAWQLLVAPSSGIPFGPDLPDTGTAGDIFFNETDEKLYRWTDDGWTAEVEAVDIAGLIAGTQIETLSAGQITGQLVSAQIQSLVATKLTGQIVASQIGTGAVLEDKLASNAVTVGKIANGAVTGSKIADLAITNPKLAALAVEAGNLATNAVTTTKIADNAVTTPKLIAGAVVADKIAARAVTATKIYISDFSNLVPDSKVTEPGSWVLNAQWSFKSNPNNLESIGTITCDITSGQTGYTSFAASGRFDLEGTKEYFASVNVNSTHPISAVLFRIHYFDSGGGGIVTYAEFSGPTLSSSAPSTIGGRFIVPANAVRGRCQVYVLRTGSPDNSVNFGNFVVRRAASGELIVDGAVIADKIAANAVTTAKLDAGAVTTPKIAAGAVTANEIAAGSVVADKIASNAITTDKLAANSVTTAKIAANAVTANEIAANAVTAVKVQAGAIGTDKLAANAVTADKIAANTITARELLLTDYTNLVQNPGFDAGSTGWILGGTSSVPGIPEGWPDNKANFLQISGSGVTMNGNTEVKCKEGDAFLLVVVAHRGFTAPSNNMQCRIRFELADGTPVVSIITWTPSDTTTYQRRTITGVAPANAVKLRVDFNHGTLPSGYYRVGFVGLYRRANAELIVDGAIIADKIAANAVVTAKIATNAVTANEILAGSITTAKIATNAVTTDKIAANAVTANEILAGAVTAAKINVTNLAAISANLGAITAGSLNINNRFIVDTNGNTTIRSGTSGERTEITNTGIRIYDASNTLRVSMGVL